MDKIYRKNDSVTVTIEDLGAEGEGIGKIDGFPLFVKDAVPGDTVEVKIVKCKKNYAYARLEKVVTPSPFRVESKCAFHRKCGGCQLQALSYEKQLEFKQQKIRNNLIRIGGFSSEYIDERMEPIIGMDEPFYYRNKAQYPVGTDRDGNVITGFYAGRTHHIVANTECYLGALENREILEVILKHMRRYNVSAYDEMTGKGLVRHVLIRKGFTSGEIMVCLIINKMLCGGKKKDKSCEKAEKNKLHTVKERIEYYPETDLLKVNARKEEKTEKVAASADNKFLSGQTEFIPEQSRLLQELAAIKGMTSVSVSINTERTNVIMGKEIYTLWGSPFISDTIHVRDMRKDGYPFTGKELTFHISPLSFYQVNPVQTEKLYSLVLEYAGLTGKETVWDLYCGIGTISLFLAGSARKVYGVEIVSQAIDDARENGKRNGIRNVDFFTGRVEDILPQFYAREARDREVEKGQTDFGDAEKEKAEFGDVGKEETDTGDAGKGETESGSVKKGETKSGDVEIGNSEVDMVHPDVIVVDPPRKGCDAACLNTMLKMKPERIVYVSCDSATLARDMKVLCGGGYEIVKIRGVDQFGMTVHVETVVLLSQQKPDDVIEVEIELDELDLTSAESKATYAEIKDYVLKEHGLKVSSLYISQVKRKCGIEVGENYNLPKSEDSRQPQCPEEKEKAIRDALEHFGMV